MPLLPELIGIPAGGYRSAAHPAPAHGFAAVPKISRLRGTIFLGSLIAVLPTHGAYRVCFPAKAYKHRRGRAWDHRSWHRRTSAPQRIFSLRLEPIATACSKFCGFTG